MNIEVIPAKLWYPGIKINGRTLPTPGWVVVVNGHAEHHGTKRECNEIKKKLEESS
jgi:hypothetical protein